jgi:outer membrane lipoprotein-sorting protein
VSGAAHGVRTLAAALFASALAACVARAAPAPAPARPLEASRVLVERLTASGRASARIDRRETDPFSNAVRTVHARLSLEPPDRARLDFEPNGESVTLRGDGGEWLQPQLGQMLKLSSEQASAALRWWQLLLPGGTAHFRERPLTARRFLVIAPGDAGAADSAWVDLDRAGLPARLAFRDASGEEVSVAFREWRFERPRGKAAFVLAAPPGIQTIDMP